MHTVPLLFKGKIEKLEKIEGWEVNEPTKGIGTEVVSLDSFGSSWPGFFS